MESTKPPKPKSAPQSGNLKRDVRCPPPPPAVVGVERGTFNSTEVKLLVDTATGEWKSLILLGYYAGARLSDCCRMAWDNVTFTSATLAFTQGKTGRKLTVPIHPEWFDYLDSFRLLYCMLTKSTFLFFSYSLVQTHDLGS